jgi:uncharacterized protein YndB with AHSA1/START domain
MTAEDGFVRALTGDAEEQTVTLVRSYRSPIGEVWNALTSPERIARWYGTIVGPVPRVAGDAFQVDIGGGMVRRAVLEGCEAPAGLTYTWWSGDDDPGLVQIRLEGIGDETRVSVQHDRLRPHRTIQYGAGWEQNLVALAGVVGAPSAGEVPTAARPERWEALRAHPLHLEFEIDAPVAAVWDAWSSADALAEWWWNHWPDVTIAADVRPGGEYRFDAPEHGFTVSGEYLVVEPRRRLAFTWVWTDKDGALRDEAVDVAFRETATGTALVIRHTGPWAESGPAESYRQGWEFVLAELARRLG